MTGDCPLWWLHMPPCAECGQSHVLIDCTKRLSWEVGHE